MQKDLSKEDMLFNAADESDDSVNLLSGDPEMSDTLVRKSNLIEDRFAEEDSPSYMLP